MEPCGLDDEARREMCEKIKIHHLLGYPFRRPHDDPYLWRGSECVTHSDISRMLHAPNRFFFLFRFLCLLLRKEKLAIGYFNKIYGLGFSIASASPGREKKSCKWAAAPWFHEWNSAICRRLMRIYSLAGARGRRVSATFEYVVPVI